MQFCGTGQEIFKGLGQSPLCKILQEELGQAEG